MTARDAHAGSWWASLTHGGMLIAPARISEYFPDAPPPLAGYQADRLRRDLLRATSREGDDVSRLLDTVLEDVLGLKASHWTRGNDVDSRWSHHAITGEVVRPRRVWHALVDAAPGSGAAHDPFILPLFVTDRSSTTSRDGAGERLGIGRGRRSVARVIEWLRRTGQPVALLTNGRQWRLIHAGADYEAWCEWDTELWFEDGVPSAQVTALRSLLSPAALTPTAAGERPRLVSAILDSRRGQAELSSALGERVRLAVEKLIQESAAALAAVDGNGPHQVSRRDLYIAATRVVMRCVVILFAEARDLLPRDLQIYHESYGLQGLREQLARLAGGRVDRLRHSRGAWPRLLALFDLIRRGSAHEALVVPEYGGGLFAPGDPESRDGVLRALAAFEGPANAPTDLCVHQVLELLTVSMVKVRQGRSTTWVNTPVDFSDLSSEYIGILYEGLLDFELRRAPDDDAVVFLRIGDEPALPLSRLEQEMAPKQLAELIGKLKKGRKVAAAADEDDQADGGEADGDAEAEAGDEGESESEPVAEASDTVPSGPEDAPTEQDSDFARIVRERAAIWAEKAVKEAKLVPYPRDDTDPVVRDRWQREVEARSKSLYRLVLPGEWYLVRWGGTRKGAGTFYTRPQLAVPTVRRTLQPLCYTCTVEQHDAATGLTTAVSWAPRTPEEILALKVCDPAMGSGSFLVSTLRYLTDALVESLHAHGRLTPRPDSVIVKLADGLPLEHPSQETLPVPVDHAEFDDRLRSRLKRHVVERCIYGVDLDPLAVELARMALWIETMDRLLPFGFLDHKLRCGNALIGAWFDQFQEYPAMAFERDDAGDHNHDRFVHHFREYEVQRGKKKGSTVRTGDVWTSAWKHLREEVIKPGMREWITSRRQFVLALPNDASTPQRIHDGALEVFQRLHALPVHAVGEREQLFREQVAGNPALERLRLAFDTWCAIWFWPGDALDWLPPPASLHDPASGALEIVTRLRDEHRFFHWELEFPDVFTATGSGFDAIVGNPPWEIQKPNSKEFFSNVDPLYRTYGKQEALRAQVRYFEGDAAIEHDWLAYSARFKSFSTWNRHVAFPFGDPRDERDACSLSRSGAESGRLHDMWRLQRARHAGYADETHPFRHQGSADINTYKMFVEAGRALLRDGGYLGFIAPSGLYTDKGSTQLRRLLLDKSRWEWLFGFENRQGIFDIHRSFKFSAIIVRKGGQTGAIRTAFMHRAVEDWQEAERHVLAYPRERVAQFSPRSSAILEIRSERDLEVLEKMYRNSVLLGDDSPEGWGIKYSTEFHMTNDSNLFPPRTEWERKGYRPNEYGMWIGPDGSIALPVYEGRMIGQFDFSEKGWVSGRGRGAVWREVDFVQKAIEPQFLMGLATYESQIANDNVNQGQPKLGFMDVSSATNARTMIAAIIPDAPCGNKVPILRVRDVGTTLGLCGVLNSFAYDFQLRRRLGGLTLNYFIIEETALPAGVARRVVEALFPVVRGLSAVGPAFAPSWHALGDRGATAWKRQWAVTPHERMRMRCIVDAAVAHLYGLEPEDLAWVLAECDYALEMTSTDEFTRRLDPKGFWRIDSAQPPELRHTVLTLIAFDDLQHRGIDGFLAQNDGDGWMIPETLRLADYGLGHDDRAREHQPVASRLGPRFLPWQLEQGVEESWEECARHAEKIEALLGGVAAATRVAEPDVSPYDAETSNQIVPHSVTDLFGQPAAPPKRRRR